MKCKFKIGDRVFAKLRGYSHWPAIIKSVNDSSSILKYHVEFYGDHKTAWVKEIDTCKFLENKSLHGSPKIKSKLFTEAMREAEKSFNEVNRSSNNTLHSELSTPTLSPNESKINQVQSPEKSLSTIDSPTTFSTPTIEHDMQNLATPHKALENTPLHEDSKFQLYALTEKCISLEKRCMYLEKSLMEEKQKNSIDYQNCILNEELRKYKAEILSCNTVIETLKNDNTQLEEENKTLKTNNNCLRCYPPLGAGSQVWQRATSTVSSHHDTSTSHGDFVSVNPYAPLSSTEETNDDGSPNNNGKINKPNIGNKKKSPSHKASSLKTNNRPKLIIMADSHGKDLVHLIQQKTFVNVSATVRPGAKFNKVTYDLKQLTKDLKEKDHLFVLAGTNDIERCGVKQLMSNIQDLIRDSKHTNLLLATIPMRHDLPELDLKISRVNAEIERVALDHQNLKLVPLHMFPRHYFTTHGLHMNKSGKLKAAEKVARLLHEHKMSPTLTSEQSVSGNGLCAPLLSSNLKPKIGSGITVIETNMKDVIQHFKNDPQVAFAHTISGDFDDNRRMSAGVAVVFRNCYGRPQVSDLINDKLTLQKKLNEPWVYSLVTKDKYYGKPSKSDYDEAFLQLQKEFKARGLKTLICSAMGCVRDKIEPQHFAENIKKFHKETGASVTIISYDQVAQRKLWNGLTHKQFVKTLRDLINTDHKEPDHQDEELCGNIELDTQPSTSQVLPPSNVPQPQEQQGFLDNVHPTSPLT